MSSTTLKTGNETAGLLNNNNKTEGETSALDEFLDIAKTLAPQIIESRDKRDSGHYRTPPFLNPYERTVALGTRAKEIAMKTGVPLQIGHDVHRGCVDALILAELEMKHGVSPCIVRRELVDGTFEERSINDLRVPHA